MGKFIVNGTEFDYSAIRNITTPFAKIFNFRPYKYHNVEITTEIFPTIIVNAITRDNCRTMSDLLKFSPAHLDSIRNIGERWFIETIKIMVEYCSNHPGNNIAEVKPFIFPSVEFRALKRGLADNIRNWRDFAEMSQEQLALECDLCVQLIKDIENCTADPTLSELKKICEFIGCSVSEILIPNRYTDI